MAIEGKGKINPDDRIRLGMVGGGQDAFIGAVHRIAARFDDQFELVAGAFSSDPQKSLNSGRELKLADHRIYSTFEEMAEKESQLEDGIEVVAIVTPNHLHFDVAKKFLESDIHVICDKPLTSTLEDATKLVDLVKSYGKLFILTHNYTGYPMIRQAREMIANGDLGEIRYVQLEYVQDWLTEKLEDTGQKQALWRTDPAQSGAGGCIGDIGTHAYNLGCFVSGLTLEKLCADLTGFVPGRRLDDNASVLLRFKEGAKGMLWASQIAPGNENSLSLRVYGSKGGLEWVQEQPNHLWCTKFGEPKQLLTRGGTGTGDSAARLTRVPAGHPEGYLEGFANIYNEAAHAIRHVRSGDLSDLKEIHFPSVEDGLKGMKFVEACVKSSNQGSQWMSI